MIAIVNNDVILLLLHSLLITKIIIITSVLMNLTILNLLIICLDAPQPSPLGQTLNTYFIVRPALVYKCVTWSNFNIYGSIQSYKVRKNPMNVTMLPSWLL